MDTIADHDRSSAGYTVLSFGRFRLDPLRRVLLEAGNVRRLGSRELEILIALVERAGQIVTKDELIARVWPKSVVQESTLRVQMSGLRKALGEGESGVRHVETFSGRGYRFAGAVRVVQGEPLSAVADSLGPDFPTEQKAAEPHAVALPARLSGIIGRAQVIATLAERVPQRRFTTIVGPGGIGKTTVALAVADNLRAAYAHGVHFVDLAPLRDLERVAHALATALGVSAVIGDPMPEILAFLQDKRLLIVLDNCEHLVEFVARLAERVLRGAPDVQLLATSREPLRADGEHVHRLGPLQTPAASDTLTRGEALGFSAIQLFVERAVSSRDTFELRDQDVPILAEICRRLDGNPLAIELAAARVDLIDAQILAAWLDKPLILLTRGRRTAEARHQTLRATLDWSYELLTPVEQLMLGRLAVFGGGFTLDQAVKLVADEKIKAADVLDGLANLVAKSLLRLDDAGQQIVYRLFGTTRVYALEKLHEAGECEEIKQRHARIWCTPVVADGIRRLGESRKLR